MSADKNPLTESDVLAALQGMDDGNVPIPTGDLASGAIAQPESTTTDDAEKGQSSEEVESPEAGTESEDTEETEEKPEETEEKTEPQPEQPKAEEKPLSKEEKAKAREAKTWQKIEAEKQAIAKEREEVERAKAEIALSKAKKPEPVKDEKGFTADDYDQFAKDAERENREAAARGDEPKWSPANLELARVKAQGLRQREQFETHQQRLVAKQAAVQQAVDKYSDLKNPQSAMAKEMLKTWESNKDFWGDRPEAVAVMAELADARVKADSVPALEKKITELTKELDRLTKLSSPSKGGINSPGKGSPKGNPTYEELEAHMAALDNAGLPVG
jgi:hypothetical protein